MWALLPEGFVLRMKKLLVAEFDAFAASYDRPRNVGLRRNPQKGAQLALPEFGLTPVPWCADGFYYDAAARPGLSPLHEAGCYYLQEPSAMAPAELLDVRPGMRVLDLCAAPGGKSTQLAAKLAGCGLLVCNEIHPKRAQILAQNIERMGIANALVLNEHPKNLSPRFDGYFDRVLVDAPCSGEGMFRKEAAAHGLLAKVDSFRLFCGYVEHAAVFCAAHHLTMSCHCYTPFALALTQWYLQNFSFSKSHPLAFLRLRCLILF